MNKKKKIKRPVKTSKNKAVDEKNSNQEIHNEEEFIEEKTEQMEKYSTTFSYDGKTVPNGGNVWFPLIIFLVGTWFIMLLSSLLGGNMVKIATDVVPSPRLSLRWYTIIWVLAITLIAIATFMMWTKHKRPKQEIRENLISYFITIGVLMLWPLFFFRLSLGIVACVILGISIILSIYTTYRYYNTCIGAGIIFTFFTIWLIYLFYLNFGMLLI